MCWWYCDKSDWQTHLYQRARKEGEIPIDTAIREIREESGLVRVEIVAYLGVLIRSGFTAENTESPSVKKHIDMFYCTTDEMELRPGAEDAVAAQWVPKNELSGILTWPEELAFFEQHAPPYICRVIVLICARIAVVS